MCGSIKASHWASKKPIKPGENFPSDAQILSRNNYFSIQGKVIKTKVQWDGFAREENISSYKSKGWVRGELLATHYTEGGNTYSVPSGSAIQVVTKEITPIKTILRVITRDAIGNEAEVHDRWPVIKTRQIVEE